MLDLWSECVESKYDKGSGAIVPDFECLPRPRHGTLIL